MCDQKRYSILKIESKSPRGGVALYKNNSCSIDVEIIYDGFRDCVVLTSESKRFDSNFTFFRGDKRSQNDMVMSNAISIV